MWEHAHAPMPIWGLRMHMGGWCLDGYLDGYALKWAPLEPQRHRVSVLGIEHRPKTSVRCKGACMQLRVVQNAQDFDLCPRSVH